MKKILFALNLFFSSTLLAYEQNSGWNLALKTGALAEEITRPKTSETTGKTGYESFLLGGIPLGIGLHKDYSEKFSFVSWGSLLLDIPNQILSRQGIEAGIDYHLLGGGKRSVVGGDLGTVVSENSSQLSFAMRCGTFHYAAATRDGKTKISGSTFEFHTGLIFRVGSYGAGLMSSFISLPASTELLTAKSVEFSLFWIE